MKRTLITICIATLGHSMLLGCSDSSSPVGKAGWLTGSTQEKLDTVAKHLRGNDLVMMEVDWRFQRLARAGVAENWAAAAYQLDKLRLTMELGKERRPKRAESYDWFFQVAFPPLVEAVAAKDKTLFLDGFPTFVARCNTCHAKEHVEFFTVVLPPLLE